MGELLLEMKEIVKGFPGVRALRGANLSILKGEVHSLVGENGAGKSTMIKILTSIYKCDSGQIVFDGKPFIPENSMQVQNTGISTIYQELNLIPYLTVAENIFLGREPKKHGIIDWKTINSQAKTMMENLGINIDVTRPVNTLSTAFQQMTAIARAISFNVKLVVMDEPTSSLDKDEVDMLFSVIRKLKEKQVSVLFITHRLDEIYTICDRVTIMRDGEFIGCYDVKNLDKLKLISLMIGRDASKLIDYIPPAKNEKNFGETLLQTEQVRSGSKLRGASISIKQGEGVGLAGLLGSGRSEFAKAIFGANRIQGGSIEIEGKKKRLKGPTDAIHEEFAFLPEDRKVEGIIPNMSVKENISIVMLPKISKHGIISKKVEEEITSKYINRLKILTPNMNQKIKFLSGGNQQKVLLARWIANNPKLIILDEPTRGIDVGAKAEIESLIKELLKEGRSVLMISSEFGEVIRSSDRIIVMRDGKNVAELSSDEFSEDNIISCIAAGNLTLAGGVH